MEESEFLKNGYERVDNHLFSEEWADKLYQKAIFDCDGIRYYINIYHVSDTEKKPYHYYKVSVLFIKDEKDKVPLTVNFPFETIEKTEDFLSDMWIKMNFSYCSLL